MRIADSNTDQRPVLGLDVDGVIALSTPPEVRTTTRRISAWGRWSRSIDVPDSAPATVARLAEAFDIVWVSSWGHNAHTSLRDVLGLPAEPWPFLPVQFGQAHAVADYARGRPWALVHDGVDDDRGPGRGVVVCVDGRRGIDELDVDRLVADVRGLGADGGPLSTERPDVLQERP